MFICYTNEKMMDIAIMNVDFVNRHAINFKQTL